MDYCRQLRLILEGGCIHFVETGLKSLFLSWEVAQSFCFSPVT